MDDGQDDAAVSLPQPPPSPYRSLRLEGTAPPPAPPPPPPPGAPAPPPRGAASVRRLDLPSSRPGRRSRPARSGADRFRLVLVLGVAVLVLIAFVRGLADGRPTGSSSPRPTFAFASTSTLGRPTTTPPPAPTTSVARTTTTVRDPSDAFCAAWARSRVANLPAGPYVDEFARMTAETVGRTVNADFENVLAQLRTRLARVGASASFAELWGDLVTNVRSGDTLSRVLVYGGRCNSR